jgi:hypothetical protein
MIRVIDNFLTLGYYNEVEELMLGNEFPWYFQSDITNAKKGTAGFTHAVVRDGVKCSETTDFLLPLALQIREEVGASKIFRLRGDMVLPTKGTHAPHLDYKLPHIAAILYIGESNGDTIIYNETASEGNYEMPSSLTEHTRVTPEKNRLVLFSGDHWHTGGSPSTNYKRRVILNSNYILREDLKWYGKYNLGD